MTAFSNHGAAASGGYLAPFPCKFPRPRQHPTLPSTTNLQRKNNLPAVKLSSYLDFRLKSVQINSIKKGLKALFSLLNQRDSCNETFLTWHHRRSQLVIFWNGAFSSVCLWLYGIEEVLYLLHSDPNYISKCQPEEEFACEKQLFLQTVSVPLIKAITLLYSPRLAPVPSPSQGHQCHRHSIYWKAEIPGVPSAAATRCS